MKIVYFWLTVQGKKLAERLCERFDGTVEPKENFKNAVREDFYNYDALIFITASGIAVRSIAPLIQNKKTDPAVIVIDHKGKYVISLLSGHLGGANLLAHRIASEIGAVPVITTATDVEGVISFDETAKSNNLVIENPHILKYISGAMLENKIVEVITDIDIEDNETADNINITQNPKSLYRVVISDRLKKTPDGVYTLNLRPKNLIIGIGCKKNISFEYLERCFINFLETYELSYLSVSRIATIELKKNEPAILELCHKYNINCEIISENQILECDYDFEKSEFVQQITGVPSVAEACSYIASNGGEVITGKVKYNGITMSACRISGFSVKLNTRQVE